MQAAEGIVMVAGRVPTWMGPTRIGRACGALRDRYIGLLYYDDGGVTVSTGVVKRWWRAAGLGNGVNNIRDTVRANDSTYALAA